MKKEAFYKRLNTSQYLLVTLLMFVVGCAVATRTTPPAIATPSRTAAQITPIHTTTPSPSSTTETQNPLEQSLEALSSISSVHIRTTYYEASAAGPITPALTTDVLYSPGPPEQIQFSADWGDGLVLDYICLGPARIEHCWSKVGQHPWTVHDDWISNPTWLEERQQELAATRIISSTIMPDSNQIIVAWRRSIQPRPTGMESAQGFETGQTWLQAATYLPIREVVAQLSPNEQLLNKVVTIFSDYNASMPIEAPVAATVTPVPTMPITPWAPGVDKPTREEELPFAGVLFVPDLPGRFPAVVVLHGSEGGVSYSKDVARRLAQKGFGALALCYFGCPETPTDLENINVENVIQAVDYLKSHPDIRSDAIALLGSSRGAELALIVGALNPDVHAVISVMGIPWVIGGYPSGGTAWLYQGQPLPFRNIPVEQINGPVLIIHGEHDVVWAVDGAYLVADRLAAHRRPYELAVYSDRGHNIGVSPLDAINRIVDFLNRAMP